MRALVCKAYGTPEMLVIEDHHTPEPGEGQVRVAVKAAGINFPDLLNIAGSYQVKTPLPFVPGNEAAGVVAAAGDGVTRFKAGDRVIITPPRGAFAEQCVVPESLCMPLPDSLDFEQGAGFTITYATALHAFRHCARLAPAETVLVLGAAGGVGVAAIETACAMGARVIAAASNEEKLAFAGQAGAHEGVNYADDNWREQVSELSSGKGVDVVFDPVGGDLAQHAFKSLAWHGRYLVIGFASGGIPRFPANIALLKEASIIGVWWGTWLQKHPAESLQNMRELTEFVNTGKLRPRVTESHPLKDYVKALASISERRAMGKVVLTMD